MYPIEIYNHETNQTEGRKEFTTKREANKFLRENAQKRGYDYFCKNNRQIEYNVCF